jgi:spoIIIJ-associated protein
MEMKRIEAETLEEAYSKAAQELSCSVTEINYEIIQHPNAGMMGLFKKKAVIIAIRKSSSGSTTFTDDDTLNNDEVSKASKKKTVSKHASITVTPKKKERVVSEKKPEKEVQKSAPANKKVEKKRTENFKNASSVVEKKDEIVDGFFNDNITDKRVAKSEPTKEIDVGDLLFDDDRDTPENRALSEEIENKIKKLMSVACFEIDTVEVDVFNGIVHIFIDGEDAALVIGKEGYRYNALSYMLFNWINSHYDLYIKLEIAEFIQAQEEMIENYLKPIAEHIIEHGRGKTKPLDGILVQIALEKLRAMFPNKYIAIKTGKDGKKFILINNFNNQKQK